MPYFYRFFSCIFLITWLVSFPAVPQTWAKDNLPEDTAEPARKKTPPETVPTGSLLAKVRNGEDFTIEEMEAWIAQTTDVNMCLDNGKTMLLYVVANSVNLDALRLLMEYGADVQTHCVPRYEALFIAAINNPSPDILELLINNGANLVEKDHEGNTALLLAATFNKSARVIDTLLDYGLKVNIKNSFGFDALTLASYSNPNILVLQSLLDNGADISATDKEGHTALMAAAVRGDDNIMQYLIKRGADFNAKDKNGLSVLDYYNKRKYLETLNFEVSAFATPSEKLSAEFKFIAENHHKYNKALQESIFKQDADAAVEDAINNLADIDISDSNGCTTFLNAALHNKKQSVLKKLLDGKADINAVCMEGKNALIFLALQADENHEPEQQINKLKMLIDGGIEINHTDESGRTALMYALANHAATAFIQELLKYGADPNIKDHRGETPLWYLLRTNSDETLIQILLRGGADMETPNAEGDTPLWYVLNKGGSDTVIKDIILAQKDLNIKNKYGETPLLFALKNNYPAKIVKLLLNRGADPTIRDSEGNNAYDILRDNRYFDAAIKKRTRERVINEWK